MDVYQRRRLVALSALAGVFIVIVLLIRSCGGDEETGEPLAAGASGASGVAGAALSQEQFIAQGDQICRSINTSISEIDAADANAAADEQGTDIASELDQLQSLGAPTDGQDQLDKFLQALQDQVDAYEKRSVAVERGDETAVADLDAEISDAEDTAAAAAQNFGFAACGDFGETAETGGGGGGGGGGTETTTPESTTGGTVTPTVPIPTTPVPTTPAPDTGTAAPDTGTAPPDTGDTGTGDTGGVTP